MWGVPCRGSTRGGTLARGPETGRGRAGRSCAAGQGRDDRGSPPRPTRRETRVARPGGVGVGRHPDQRGQRPDASRHPRDRTLRGGPPRDSATQAPTARTATGDLCRSVRRGGHARGHDAVGHAPDQPRCARVESADAQHDSINGGRCDHGACADHDALAHHHDDDRTRAAPHRNGPNCAARAGVQQRGTSAVVSACTVARTAHRPGATRPVEARVPIGAGTPRGGADTGRRRAAALRTRRPCRAAAASPCAPSTRAARHARPGTASACRTRAGAHP